MSMYEPDCQEHEHSTTTYTNSSSETLVGTQYTDEKDAFHVSISKVVSGISESDSCSTCSKHKEEKSSSFLHPAFPRFSSVSKRCKHCKHDSEEGNEPSNDNNNYRLHGKHGHSSKLRATFSRIPKALEKRLAKFKEMCKEEKARWKNTNELLRVEHRRRMECLEGSNQVHTHAPPISDMKDGITSTTTNNTKTKTTKTHKPPNSKVPKYKAPVRQPPETWSPSTDSTYLHMVPFIF